MTLDHETLKKRRNSDVLPRYFTRKSEEKENNDVKRGSYIISRSEPRQYQYYKSRSRAMRFTIATNCPNSTQPNNREGSIRKKSKPVSRSQSMKTPNRRSNLESRRVSNETMDHHRSSPNLGRIDPDSHERLRNFSITRKGAIVNRGDSFRSKSRSSHSVASSRSSKSSESPQSEVDLPKDTVSHRVLMMGASDVGKTALTTQFKTSEYICACDASQDNAEEKSVTVVVDDQEAQLIFIDPLYGEQSIKYPIIYNPDAYIIVYSVTSRSSFKKAKELLTLLNKNEESMSRRTVILVANKTDLARSKIVSTEEGRYLAKSSKCKYIETSVGINHNVDNLLVGILSQIRLRKNHNEKSTQKENSGNEETKIKGKPGTLLKKILRKAYNSRTKSCDNLQTL